MSKQKFTLQQIQSALYQVKPENKTAKQACKELDITATHNKDRGTRFRF